MKRIQDPSVNSTTRTHPRTLSQAFPRAPEWRENDPMHRGDMVITVVGLVLIVLTLVVTWLGH